MNRSKLLLSLALMASEPMQASAYSSLNCRVRNDVMNVMTDVLVVRPVGFAGTLAGGALFLGISPLTGLASIAPPHDAFTKVANILVGMPYAYTFERPLGYFQSTCQ